MPGEAKAQLKEASQQAKKEFHADYQHAPHASSAAYTAPGRLGNATLALGADPRANAQLLPTIKAIGMGTHGPPPSLATLDENSTLDEIGVMVNEFNEGLLLMYNGGVSVDLPGDAHERKVEMVEETIAGGDGQDMLVYVYRPADQTAPLPGIMFSHGGGMVVGTTMNPIHDRWCKSLAAQGCVVVMPDFRNAWTKNGYHHFPAGLNDCVAAAKWITANKEKLKVRNLVLEGESGGANLSLAIALKAKREGWVKDIAGVYALVPYISNAWGWPEEKLLKELPSLVECNGYFIGRGSTAYIAHFYTPTDEHQQNPLAWPYYATLEDMKGLPPHNLVMDELDPLKSEGISYFRRLVEAGVEARGSLNLGVIHASSLIFRSVIPAYHKSAVRDIAAFAAEL